MKKRLFLSYFLLLISYSLFAQSVGIGTSTPHSSAALEINNNSKGLLIPTMTAAQRNTILSPAKGLMVYDTTNNAHYFYNGNNWKPIGSSQFKTDSSLNIGNQIRPVSNYILGAYYINSSDTAGYLYDNGGPAGNYGNNRNDNFTIFQGGALGIILELQEMDTEDPYDSLRITVGSFTRTYWGTQTDTLIFDDLTASVAINFKSNSVNTQAGFKLYWKKILIGSNPATGYDSTQKSGWYYNEVKQYMRGGINGFNNWHPDSSGIYSFSFGNNTKAKGSGSFSAGTNTSASGPSSIAMGYGTTASGNYSTAMGNYTTASGAYSTSMGIGTKASGSQSTAMGAYTTGSGIYSTAMGNYTTASGGYSTAMGYFTNASGDNSTAIGYFTTASGGSSTAMGADNKASGGISTTMGQYTTASGNYSTAMGYSTTASGYSSIAMGRSTKSKSYNGLVIGSYNDSTNAASSSSFNSNNRIFQIGNGTADNARSNAMTVLHNGNVGIGELVPIAKLHVSGYGSINQIRLDDTLNDKSIRISNDGGANGPYIGTATNHPFSFVSNNAVRAIITNAGAFNIKNDLITESGKVGIGETTPLSHVHISGSGSTNQIRLEDTINNKSIRISNDGGANGPYIGTATNHPFSFVSNNAVRAIITNAGAFNIKNDLITESGKVGIGETTPLSHVHISGSGSTNQIRLEDTINNKSIRISNDGGASGPYIGTSTNHPFSLVSNNAVRAVVTSTGTIDVKNDLTVQNGKGILRNTDGTQSKKLSTTVTVNTLFSAGQTLNFPITWPETFSSSPEAFVGNVISGTGGWAEVVMTISGAGTSGATLFVYNPKSGSVTPNFTVKIIAIGPQ